MNINETDNRLQQLFHELKQQDATRTPGFERLTRAPVQPAQARPWAWWVPATAVLVVAGLSLSLFHGRSHQPEPDTRQWAVFSTWETPTDVLLDVSDWTSSAVTVSDKATIN